MSDRTKRRLVRLAISAGLTAIGIVTGANLPDNLDSVICNIFGIC